MTKFTSGELQRGITFVPDPQSPFKAGAIVNVGGDAVTSWTNQGWLECDGSEYPEASYAQLFSQIGSKYNTGGETASHFRVPNGPRSTPWIDLDTTGLTSSDIKEGKVFQDTTGDWHITFNFSAATASSTNKTVAIAGITWAENLIGVAFYHGGSAGSGQTLSGNSLQFVTAVSEADFRCSATIKLASKPTDAFVGADARFSTFDEALESQPMIKVYNDASNIAMSLSDATASLTGAVRLSSDFAASTSVYGFVKAPNGTVRLDTGLGQASANNRIRTFTNSDVTGDAFTYTADTTDGDYLTVNRDMIATFDYVDEDNIQNWFALTVNDSAITTDPQSMTYAQGLLVVAYTASSGSGSGHLSITRKFESGDVIRAKGQASQLGVTTQRTQLHAQEVLRLG